MQLHLNIMESTARTLKVRLGQTHYLQDKSITPFEVVCALKVQRCFRDMKARKLDDMSLKEKAVSRRRNAVADCGSPLARTGDGSPYFPYLARFLQGIFCLGILRVGCCVGFAFLCAFVFTA